MKLTTWLKANYKKPLFFLPMLFIALPAIAFTSSDFLAKTQGLINNRCFRVDQTERPSETAAFCYLFFKSQETDTTLASHSTTLSDLQSSINSVDAKTKRAALYDGNNVLLGYQLGMSRTETQVYNPVLGRTVIFDALGRLQSFEIRYEQTNCNGEPYYSVQSAHPLDAFFYLALLKNSNGRYFVTDSASSPSNIALPSYRDVNGDCLNSITSGTAIKLKSVSLPFSEPIIMPLSIRFE